MKRAVHKTLVRLILVAASLFTMHANAGERCLVLSNGSMLHLARYDHGILTVEGPLIRSSVSLYAGWPSFSMFLQKLVFEARQDGQTGVYTLDLDAPSDSMELLRLGSLPAASPDGTAIVYLDARKMLAIRDVVEETDTVIGGPFESVGNRKRPQWLTNDKIIYGSADGSISVFDRRTRSRSELIPRNLYPLAADDGRAYLGDEDAFTLFEYSDGNLSVVLKNRFFRFGPAFLKLDDGYLYSRGTWRAALRLSENHTLFYHSDEDGTDQALVKGFTFFGGTLVPCVARVSGDPDRASR